MIEGKDEDPPDASGDRGAAGAPGTRPGRTPGEIITRVLLVLGLLLMLYVVLVVGRALS